MCIRDSPETEKEGEIQPDHDHDRQCKLASPLRHFPGRALPKIAGAHDLCVAFAFVVDRAENLNVCLLYTSYAKIELSTVRKPRHRDDGDPPANTRGKPDAGLHASYSQESESRSVLRNGPDAGSSRGSLS